MLSSSLVAFSALAVSVLAYDNSRNDNVAVYWGQNSYGAAHGADQPNWQKTISHYCQVSSRLSFYEVVYLLISHV